MGFVGSMEVFPSTVIERVFAVMVLFMSLIIFSCFVGAVTNMMLDFQNERARKFAEMHRLKRFLRERLVSTQTQRMIHKYCVSKGRYKRWVEKKDVPVLCTLPHSILVDLCAEVNGPLLSRHPLLSFIKRVESGFIRDICHTATNELALDS